MKSITLQLPNEFRLFCILFRMDPQEFLQSFVNLVIIPSTHFMPCKMSIISTDFMLQYVRLDESNIERYTDEQRDFLKKKERQYQTLRKNSGKYGAEEATEAMKFFLKFWLKEWEAMIGEEGLGGHQQPGSCFEEVVTFKKEGRQLK